MQPTPSSKLPAIILGIALILAVAVGGIFYTTKSPTGNTLTVTGSAKISVDADSVIWRSSIAHSVTEANLKTGYAQVAKDLSLVQVFLKEAGIPDTSIIISPVTVMQDWSQNNGAPKMFSLRQNIEVNSPDVEKITALSKNIQKIVDQGAFFQTDSVEYYYSKLAEARVNMLTDAIADAQARAAAMAKSTGQSVGVLRSATSGVVQVLSAGAIDNGEYGQYDTSKIKKDITITVRASFNLK